MPAWPPTRLPMKCRTSLKKRTSMYCLLLIIPAKLKLLNALFAGRHCITNQQAVEGTGLENCCDIAGSAAEIKQAIGKLLHQEFTAGMIAERASVLAGIYDNK